MKKAKFILAAIAIFAVVGGALAFKTARFNEFPVWTVAGITTTSTIIGGFTYTATVPNCKQFSLFMSDTGDIFITNARTTIPAFVKGTVIGGTATVLIPFTACPVLTGGTFVTIIQ